MKLSLTAIAALSAAFFHPTVATGTRAASSNGNTNAAEEKPGRDLLSLSAIFQDIDAAFDGGFKEEINEAGVIVSSLAAGLTAGRILSAFGVMVGNEKLLPLHVVQSVLGLDDSKGGLPDGLNDNGDSYVSAAELAQGLVLMDVADLNNLDQIVWRYMN